MDGQKYKLPHEVYHETQWMIRAYAWQKPQYEAACRKAILMDGQPRGNAASDPTLAAVAERLKYHDNIAAVEKALGKVPEEYREGVFGAVVHRRPYPTYAAITTWKRWRQRFIYWAAIYRGFI